MHAELEAVVGNRNRRIHEMTLAIGTIALGVVFSMVPDIYTRSSLFDFMGLIPANVWGLYFTALGASRVVVLTINGYWPLSPLVRWNYSLISIFTIWTPITASFLVSALQGLVTAGVSLAPMGIIAEATCLYALSALRAGRRHVG